MNTEFMEALTTLEHDKGIKKDIIIEAIEAALISGYKRNFSQAQNVRVDVNRDNGSIRVFARKVVVEEVFDTRLEITLDEAHQMDPNYDLG